MKTNNVIGSVLQILGIIVIAVGIIASLIIAYDDWYGFNGTVFLIGALGSAFSGLVFLGFAEIIIILHDCRKALNRIIGSGVMPSDSSADAEAKELANQLPAL